LIQKALVSSSSQGTISALSEDTTTPEDPPEVSGLLVAMVKPSKRVPGE
jgi:hypothetical protein